MLVTLSGKDWYAIAQRRRGLVGDKEFHRFSAEDGVGALIGAIGQADLFGESKAVVIDQIFAFTAADQNRLAEHLAGAQSSDQLVLATTDSKLPKGNLAEVLRQGRLEEFPEMKAAQLISWVQREAETRNITVQKSALPKLIDKFNGDKYSIVSELERLRWEDPPVLDEQSVMRMQPLGGEVDMFGVTDLWSHKKERETLVQLRTMWQHQIAAQLVIAMLERQVRLLLLVSGTQGADSLDQLKLHPYVMTKLSRAVKNWSVASLLNALELLYVADVSIKKGQIGAQLAIEKWVVESLMDARLSSEAQISGE